MSRLASHFPNPRAARPRAGDAILFSSLLAAGVGAALTWTAASVVEATAGEAICGLAFFGTLCVYNVDRLRDLPRDQVTSPLRSRYVELHRPGLLHRRLKSFPGDPGRARIFQALYVTFAWLAVVVGLPLLFGKTVGPAPWLAGSCACALGANLCASIARESRGAQRAWLRVARFLAAGGMIAAWTAPHGLWALAWIPAAELASLIPYRNGERYALGVVDGALIAGALAAWTALP